MSEATLLWLFLWQIQDILSTEDPEVYTVTSEGTTELQWKYSTAKPKQFYIFSAQFKFSLNIIQIHNDCKHPQPILRCLGFHWSLAFLKLPWLYNTAVLRCLVFIFCGSILDNLGLCSRHCEIHPALVNEFSYTKISIIASGVCQSTYSFVWYLKKTQQFGEIIWLEGNKTEFHFCKFKQIVVCLFKEHSTDFVFNPLSEEPVSENRITSEPLTLQKTAYPWLSFSLSQRRWTGLCAESRAL